MSITDIPTDLTTVEQVVEIPVEAIRPAPDNPRGSLGDLSGLVATIKMAGIRQPITVTPRPEDDQPPYMIVMGHRRHAAAIEAGLTVIPAIIKEMSEDERVADMHIENMNRDDLKPTEEAVSIKALKDLGLSEREVAQRIGRSQPYVNKRLSLLSLPEDVKTELDKGRMSVENALDLASVKDEKKIASILQRCRRLSDDGKTPFYEGIGVAVSTHKEMVKREKEVRQIERSLRAEGVTVVDYPANHAWTGKTRRLGDGYNEVHVDVAKHAKKPCHGAAVKPTTAEVVFVCTDHKRHEPKPGKATQPGDAAAPSRVGDNGESAEDVAAERERAEVEAWAEYERREAEQEQAELAAAAEKRHEFIRSLVRGKHNKNDALTLILTDYIAWCLDAGWSERAVQFLGLDVPEDGDTFEAITGYAGHSLANLTRAALALRMDEVEGRMPLSFVAFLDSDVRKHYEFLTANGFDPSDIEKRGLDTADAKAAEAAERAAAAEEAEDESSETSDAEQPAEAEPVEDESRQVEQVDGEQPSEIDAEQTEAEQGDAEVADETEPAGKEGDAA